MDKLRFCSIGSGSSGNCYYFGNLFQGILIDAGIASKTIRKELKQIGVELSQILGIFVTHDHHDHIKSVGTLGEKFHIPVYATTKTHEGIARSYCVSHKLSGSRRFLENGEDVHLGDFSVVSFPVSHDGTDNGGFFIRYKEHAITVATDLGYVNEHVCRCVSHSDIVVLESNYDVEMLQKGKYPYYLKKRIQSETGHLGNNEAGFFLAENWHPKLKHVFLCHLSKDNNHPDLVVQTVEKCFLEKGIRVGQDVWVEPLKRAVSGLVVFE